MGSPGELSKNFRMKRIDESTRTGLACYAFNPHLRAAEA